MTYSKRCPTGCLSGCEHKRRRFLDDKREVEILEADELERLRVIEFRELYPQQHFDYLKRHKEWEDAMSATLNTSSSSPIQTIGLLTDPGIWSKVGKYLEPKDMFNFCLTNRCVYHTLAKRLLAQRGVELSRNWRCTCEEGLKSRESCYECACLDVSFEKLALVSPAIWAIRYRRKEALQLLIDFGLDINGSSNNGWYHCHGSSLVAAAIHFSTDTEYIYGPHGRLEDLRSRNRKDFEGQLESYPESEEEELTWEDPLEMIEFLISLVASVEMTMLPPSAPVDIGKYRATSNCKMEAYLLQNLASCHRLKWRGSDTIESIFHFLKLCRQLFQELALQSVPANTSNQSEYCDTIIIHKPEEFCVETIKDDSMAYCIELNVDKCYSG
ncbi:hypothetical protein BZA77DRAFT_359494 [Pyronema omphalodes]|nr:hypothetical protein BZA77DRAFT_359494 [Pyronema omphalodes]